MKYIFLSMLIISLSGYAQTGPNSQHLDKALMKDKNLYLDFLKIDSIIIETIDPFDEYLGGFSVSRKHFSEVFEYLTKQDVHDTYKFKISNEKELMYFITILNNVKPYDLSRIKTFPNDVRDNPNIDWLHTFNQGDHLSNDPIETRTRINIYFKNGDIVTGYASPTSLDLFNYRYEAPTFTSLIWNYAAYYPEDNLINYEK